MKDNMLTEISGKLTIAEKFTKELVKLELSAKAITDKRDSIKQKILEAMTKNGITKLENDDLIISLRQATTSERFDNKKFKEENIDLYDNYITIVDVKPSIVIKIKEK